MTIARRLILLTLLTGAVTVFAQPIDDAVMQDGDWVSYRDAYRLMIRFEKYGKPKHLIQQHYQVVPKDRNVSLDGVRLTLISSSTQLNLPLDAAGRAVFPFLKAAYDSNARLMLNRKGNQYALQPRVSIAPRADGVYDIADLHAACEQVLDYLRYVGTPAMQGKQCVGVRFSYARSASDPVVRFRAADQSMKQLAVEEGSAFPGTDAPVFKTVTYRFADFPGKGQLVTQGMPGTISALFD